MRPPARLRELAPDDPRHGTRNGYTNLGCRCQACRDAQAERQRSYNQGENRLRRNRVLMERYHRLRVEGFSAREARRFAQWTEPPTKREETG